MTKMLRKLAGDRSGATAIEYGLIAAFIALALVAVLPNINTKLGDTFKNISGGLDTAAAANTPTK